MKNEFIYEEWKNLFGDQGLSDFDRDYEIQKIRDEFGRRYRPLKMSEMGLSVNFSYYDFIQENEILRLNDFTQNIDYPYNRDLEIESQLEGASPYEGKMRNCTNSIQRFPIPKKGEVLNFLRRIDVYDRLEYSDMIAFYKPFHLNVNWGIYLFTDKINFIARIKCNEILSTHQDLSEGYVFDMVYYKTYFHEIYHHTIEMLATKLEFALRTPVYGDKFYKFYCGTWGTDYCLEEAFANVYGATRCAKFLKEKYNVPESRSIEIMREYLLKDSGKGYRVSFELLDPENRKRLDELESEFLEMMISFTYDELFGKTPMAISSEFYELFTYKLDPKINFKNRVTTLLPY